MTEKRSFLPFKDIFRDLSLKHKLILIYIISTVAILATVGTVITVNEIFSARKVFVSDSEGIMRTIGKNSAAALLFQDKKDAQDTLGVLHVFPDVKYAAIKDRRGTVYAEYTRDQGYEAPSTSSQPGSGYLFSSGEARFSHEIVLHRERVGSVYLVRDLNRFYMSLYQNVGILLLAIIASLVVGYFLSVHLQRIVTDSINELLDMMKEISEKRFYSLRADVTRKDEIGDLARGFNEMLLAIEERDIELQDHRQQLERLVEKRTEELIRVNNDLTFELEERQKFEDALKASENWYRAIFENTGTSSIIIEEDTTISLANMEFTRLSGYDLHEVMGKMSWTEFIHPDFLEKMTEFHSLRRLGHEEIPREYDTKFVVKSGATRDVHLTVALLPDGRRSIASLIDMTDAKALEEQLLHSQKMEAVGKLAAGVAHDFNNILTAIIGYGNVLQITLGPDTPERSYVDSMLSAAHRAATLTQGLLAFGRKQVIAPKEIDFNDAIRSMEGLIRRMIGEDVELRCVYTTKPLTVLADSGQIGQVLMNLATNARDAMPGGGMVTIETSVAHIGKDQAGADAGIDPGVYALLTVSDRGQGMSRELTERVFEPFFTTKAVGQGTGLGLSIVYGIVTQHSGTIHVRSEPGQGTVFYIYLPLLSATATETAAQSTPGGFVIGGRETILIAEDDAMVRKYMSMILAEHGYKVIEACDGEEAIRLFEAEKDSVDLLLLDVVMPRVNGKEVLDSAERIKPGVKAIFMSGYTADIIHRKGLREDGIHFISKPVVQQELMEKIRQLLNC